MKNITHVISGLSTGGAEVLLFKLLSKLSTSQYKFNVITLTDVGSVGVKIEKLGIPVHSLGMKKGIPSINFFLKLKKAIKEFSPDILQGWMYHGNLLALFSSRFCNSSPKIIWGIFNCIDRLSQEKWSTRQLIKLGAKYSRNVDVIINNSVLSSQQHKAFGYSGKRSVVIPNGIDTTEFCPNPHAYASLRSELKIPENNIVVGTIGRFDPLKDHQNFFEAAGIINQLRPNTSFLLAGRGIDKNNNKIGEMLSRGNLTRNVFLLGERSDVPQLMSAMDIYVSSSKMEGLPVVIGEAMASGLPCVVTDVGDSARLVGEFGLVVPPRNAKALAESVVKLIDSSVNERKQLGEKANQKINSDYSLDMMVNQYKEFYV